MEDYAGAVSVERTVASDGSTTSLAGDQLPRASQRLRPDSGRRQMAPGGLLWAPLGAAKATRTAVDPPSEAVVRKIAREAIRYSECMKYHWEWINADQVALFEEGARWSGALDGVPGAFAEINKAGPYLGSEGPVYKVTGPGVDEWRDFGSFDEAQQYVENIVKKNGDEIGGRGQ
jgi:hypothetical protein